MKITAKAPTIYELIEQILQYEEEIFKEFGGNDDIGLLLQYFPILDADIPMQKRTNLGIIQDHEVGYNQPEITGGVHYTIYELPIVDINGEYELEHNEFSEEDIELFFETIIKSVEKQFNSGLFLDSKITYTYENGSHSVSWHCHT